MRKYVLCSLLWLSLVTTAPQAVASLTPHTAVYKVKISIASGSLTTTVAEDNDGFQVQSVIQPKGFAGLFFRGVIEENSRFSLSDDGVIPQHYWSKDELSSEPKTMDFVFDWGEQQVNGTINDEAFAFDLAGQVHDRVSIQYQLMHNLTTGQAGDGYALLDGDELKQIDVRNIGRKSIRVPYGRFDAVGIQHQAEGSKRITTLWCAEELGYLPVLIEQSRKGEVKVRAVLRDYQPAATAADASPL